MRLCQCSTCDGLGEVGNYPDADVCTDCLGVGQILVYRSSNHHGPRQCLGTTKVLTYVEYAN